jgi:hypothetical protein
MTLQASRWLFAAAMIALGITGIVNANFALAWQQVPIQHEPLRTVVAYAFAVIEVALGAGLLFERTLAPTCRVLFAWMVLWLVLLQVPNIIQFPANAGSWGSVGEIAIITAGAWCLYATHTPTVERVPFAAGSRGIVAARWLLVAALPLIGAEVIIDALNAGDKIMMAWLQWMPDPMAWACLTGVGSIATCLALLFGVWPRLAATIEAAMLGLISATYWGPDLYTGETATTAFIISFLIAAGVWLVADTYRDAPWLATGWPVWKA